MRTQLFFIFLLLSIFKQSSATVKTLNSLKNKETVSASKQMCNQVKLKWARIVDIAHVKLFALDCSSFNSAVKSSQKSLEFTFKRNIKADFFKKAANQSYEDNLSLKGKQRSVALNFSKTFNENYQNIQNGDVYFINYDINEGVSLFKNNILLVTHNNQAFAGQYLNIWLGEKPAIKSLKKLLENSFN